MTDALYISDSVSETQSVTFILDKCSQLSELANLQYAKYQKAIVYCDEQLKDDWWPQIKRIIESKIRIAHIEYLEASESTKNLESYVRLANQLGDLKCSRDDLIIAIGGGTILDIIAYLASTYMRGIPLMMIPTTLIGQADASTAGKTCINTNYAKNVMGTLYMPVYVYNNINFLDTNSEYHQRQGFSEIFKYALLGSKRLLELLKRNVTSPDSNTMIQILKETIAVRLSIRKRDPLASNFGHTFGHALEKISNFEVNHGDAISVGMVMALCFSLEQKLIKPSLFDEILGLMNFLKLNTAIDASVDANKLTELMLTDKKSSNTEVRLVLIRDIAIPLETNGKPFFPVVPETIKLFLQHFLKKNEFVKQNHWTNLKGDNAI